MAPADQQQKTGEGTELNRTLKGAAHLELNALNCEIPPLEGIQTLKSCHDIAKQFVTVQLCISPMK